MSHEPPKYPRRWESPHCNYYIEVREPSGPSFNIDYDDGFERNGICSEVELWPHLRTGGGAWREVFHHLPAPPEAKAEPQSFEEVTMLRELLADSQAREKQERALRAAAEAEVAKLRERVVELERRNASHLETLTLFALDAVKRGDFLTTEQYLAEIRSRGTALIAEPSADVIKPTTEGKA